MISLKKNVTNRWASGERRRSRRDEICPETWLAETSIWRAWGVSQLVMVECRRISNLEFIHVGTMLDIPLFVLSMLTILNPNVGFIYPVNYSKLTVRHG